MVRVPSDVTASRARWLGELSDALKEAQAAVLRLGQADPGNSELLDLAATLDATSDEVSKIRSGREGRLSSLNDPEWMRPSVWCQLDRDCA